MAQRDRLGLKGGRMMTGHDADAVHRRKQVAPTGRRQRGVLDDPGHVGEIRGKIGWEEHGKNSFRAFC